MRAEARACRRSFRTRSSRGASTPRDQVRTWMPLFARFREVVEWALDVGVDLARDYDEEIEAMRPVRPVFLPMSDALSL